MPQPDTRNERSPARVELVLSFESMEDAVSWIETLRNQKVLPEGEFGPVLATTMRFYVRKSG